MPLPGNERPLSMKLTCRRPRQNAKRLDDVVTFNWEMVTTADGEVAGVGLDFVLGADGRIRIDYQFIES
jgi:hypothetical protein